MNLSAAAAEFRKTTDAIKLRNAQVPWYPYDSFAVFPLLERILPRLDLLAAAGEAPILDLGCGDGVLAFFFESLGHQVLAIDNPAPNFNQTRGFETLRSSFGSRVEFQPLDLDTAPRFEGRTFGLALCLGLLYHLKNPYMFLESLSRASRYCLLSTRVAERTTRGTHIADDPVGFLLNPKEANDDDTNYWVFSDAGLKRMLDRTGWDICHYATAGPARSNPSAADADQRAYCLLSSKRADPWVAGADLAGGWHDLERDSWRWTESRFAAVVPAAGGTLRFDFTIPPETIELLGGIRIRASVNGAVLGWADFSAAGEHCYAQAIPGEQTGPALILFELDRRLPPGEDRRELGGIQVVFWTSTDGRPEARTPIRAA